MSWQEIFTAFPVLLAPVVFWLAYKIVHIENKLMGGVREDIAEMKTDIKWLVEKHRNEK